MSLGPGLGSAGHKATPDSKWGPQVRSTDALPGHTPAAPAGKRQRREEGGSSSRNLPKAYGNISSSYLSAVKLFLLFSFLDPNRGKKNQKTLLSPPSHSPVKELRAIKPCFQIFYYFGAGWGAQCATRVFLLPFSRTPRKYVPPHPLNRVVRGLKSTWCIAKLLQVVNKTPSSFSEGNFQGLNKKCKCPRA